MTVTDLFTPARRVRDTIRTRRKPRPTGRRRALPGVERLEGLLLLSGTTPLATRVAAAVAPPATTESQTVSISSTGQPYPISQALPSINQFNPALGTLTSLEIQVIQGSVTTTGSFQNPNTQAATATLEIVGAVTLNGPLTGATPLTATFPAASATSPPLSSGASYNFPPVTASGIASETLTDPGLLAAYTGTGTVSPATAVTQAATITSSDNGAGIFSQVTTSSSARVTVVYHFTPPPPGTVSGFVYNDLNNNGLKNTGEPGFGSQTVVVTGTTTSGQTVPAETTTTDTTGFYSFTDLPAGTYTVTETTEPAGFLRNKDSRNGVVLPIGPVDSIPGIVVTAGNTSPNNDFGKLAPSTVSGFVYGDTNANGIKNPGEPGFGNQTVILTGTNDLGQSVSLPPTVTSTSGAYSFGGLRPGTYTVAETTVPTGFRPFKNSRNGVVLPYNKASDTIPGIVTTVGSTAPNNNFGLIASGPNANGPSSLSGYVFDDTDNDNGIKNPGEPGLANVSVTITGTDELGDTVSMTTRTNASGFYQFSGLFAATYKLTEGPSPTNFHHGFTSVNNVVVPNSKGTGVIPAVPLADQQVRLNNDFAELRNSSPQMVCGPLNITNIQRYGLHNEPTEIVLTFNEALDAATALNPANYVLRNTVNFVPVGPATSYRAIVYNATADTVTLITSAPVNVHDQYLLSVSGIKCVNDAFTLSGTSGIQGTPYTVTVNRSQLSGFLTNQGVFIPVSHGQFAAGTFGLVPPVGGASSAALAGYPIALSSLPAQVNGTPSGVIIGSNSMTSTTTKTTTAAASKPATKPATVAAVKTTTAAKASTPKPFSIG